MTNSEVNDFIFRGSDLETELNKIPTKKQILIDSILVKYDKDDYEEDKYLELVDLVTTEINKLTIVETSNFIYKVSELETNVEKIVTKKDTLIDTITNKYDEADYSETNYDVIKDLISDFITNLENNEVENFDFIGSELYKELANVSTLLDDAKDLLVQEILTNYNINDYSESNYEEIITTITIEVEKLVSITDVQSFELTGSELEEKLSLIKNLEEEFEDTKENSLEELKDLIDGLADTNTPKNELVYC